MTRTVQVCTHCHHLPLSDVQGSSAVGGMVVSECVDNDQLRAGDLIRHTCPSNRDAGPWWLVERIARVSGGGWCVDLTADTGATHRATIIVGGLERRTDTRYVDYCDLCAAVGPGWSYRIYKVCGESVRSDEEHSHSERGSAAS